VLGPRLALFGWLGIPSPETSTRIYALLIVALLLVRFAAGVDVSSIGLAAPSTWSRTELWFLIEMFILTNVIFASTNLDGLQFLMSRHDIWGSAFFLFLSTIAWGFYQELIYRGILQTELVRRFGAITGLLVSNILFTFGPLHFYHFRLSAGNPEHLWIFAAVFSIGLYFGYLFRRSGNLWIVGILHGVGDCYLVAIGQLMAATKGH
jgi:membrane protease YdiL (CAAX protease family)